MTGIRDMKDIEPLLAAFVDGELDAETTQEVERRIAADPALRRIVEIHQETASLLRVACAESFYAAGAPPLARAWPRRRARRVVGWAAAAAVVAGMLGFGGGVAWTGRSGGERDRLLNGVAEYHAVYSRETVHLVEVPAQQADHLKTWLGRRVEQKLEIPDLEPDGLHFAGGRLLVLDGKPVAELVYTRDGAAPIALCIYKLDGADAVTPMPMRMDRRGELTLVSWKDGDHAYVVVGEVDKPALRDIAHRVMGHIAG